MSIERRSGGTISTDGDKAIGYAAVYGPMSEDLGGFREVIAPSAFERSLKSGVDVRALVGHDDSMVIGRLSAGTLRLSSDERGLRVEIDLPNTSYANDLRELLKRGDVSQMSFGFTVPGGGDAWGTAEGGGRLRTLKDVDLHEVSIVAMPAYPDTSVALRSLRESFRQTIHRWCQLRMARVEQIKLSNRQSCLSDVSCGRSISPFTEVRMNRTQQIDKLIEERGLLVSQLEALNKRELTPDEQAQFDALVAKVQELDGRVSSLEEQVASDPDQDQQAIDAAMASAPGSAPTVGQNSKKLDNLESRLSILRRTVGERRRSAPAPIEAPAYVSDLNDRKAKEDRSLALRGWALQPAGLTTEAQYAAAERCGLAMNSRALNANLWADAPRSVKAIEARAQSVGTTTAGGYLVPTTLSDALEKQLLYFANIREYAQVIRTSTGNPYDIPTVNDTTNKGEIIAENTAYNAQDVAFGKVTLNSYKYSSKLVNVSIELMQDSIVDIPKLLGDLLGERLGRIQADHFSTGTGSSQPQGLVTGASAGVTAASATAIAVNDLLGLVHSLDRAYRPDAKFMMHDSVLLAVRKLQDTLGRPIFSESYIVGEPDRLFGYPVIINNSMASSIATTNKTVLFGDFSKYVIRDALDVQVVRLDERYAEYGQVAFTAFLRSDAKVLISSAIKLLTQA